MLCPGKETSAFCLVRVKLYKFLCIEGGRGTAINVLKLLGVAVQNLFGRDLWSHAFNLVMEMSKVTINSIIESKSLPLRDKKYVETRISFKHSYC
jgi:hypothetical protein